MIGPIGMLIPVFAAEGKLCDDQGAICNTEVVSSDVECAHLDAEGVLCHVELPLNDMKGAFNEDVVVKWQMQKE